MKYIIVFILVHWVFATPQFNLFYTDWVDESVSDKVVQRDCLRLVVSDYNQIMSIDQQITTYCMSESSLKFDVETDTYFPRFTFDELSKRNITSEQLYLWSTPIDIIERYQFYLTSNDLSLATESFTNCALPRFGPVCQYELDSVYSNRLSLYEIIRKFYSSNPYYPAYLTCYTHLKCNRGLNSSCLDWREICDGKINCLDDASDEKDCWQMEINDCLENEYRCTNGQCIPQSFYNDKHETPDCFDSSDVLLGSDTDLCKYKLPNIACEDIRCPFTIYKRDCMQERTRLLLQAMYSNKD